MKRLWIVNDLYVHPEFRKKSVARTLLREARQFAESTGAGGLTLKTALTNEPAQGLYTSLGWKKDEVFCSYNLKIGPA
jgi:ribosomal protein S18 acetylase RimI-like enzyme